MYFVRTKAKPQTTPAQPILSPDEDEQARGQRTGAAPTAAREPEELVKWVAPFRKEDETVLATREQGFGGMIWNPTGTAIFLGETKDGETKFKRFELNKEMTETVLWSYKGAEQNPGSPVLSTNANGASVLDDATPKILLRGTNTTTDEEKNPSRPFLNSFDTQSKKMELLWKCEEKAYQTIDGILNAEGTRLLVDHQTATEPSNSFLFEGGKRTKQVTQNKDYAPDLTEAKRYRFQVTRADGFKFWVKVTAPKWHAEGDRLPAFFWFYPSEVDNQAAYDRGIRSTNPNMFPAQGGSPKSLLIRRGWALVEPDCPIVGPRTRVNDFYVDHLRQNLSATIDALEVKGIADRTKLALGGHSYGGFSTVNAMVHTPFFKAGIAGAGNYNRTLTPIAFQGEQRTLFEARSTYLDMSPILYAENLSGALLMYAGMDDQNVGTDPINSARLFNVLESIGKPAALYMYPHEDHGQIARETLMDQWARWIAWLDKYVLGKDK
jgi:dienelactone hydrolase